MFGILPFVGEIADTAKLARAGIKVADTAHDAGKVIDAVKAILLYQLIIKRIS